MSRERGRFADDRDVDDVAAVDRCDYCTVEPCAIILVDGEESTEWECYNCGHDPDEDPQVTLDDVEAQKA